MGGAKIRQWFSAGSRLVWATAVLLALLTWPIVIRDPAPGLDNSWMSGLYMSVNEGRDFGTEVIFTYGPLGFLAWPQLWFGWLAVLAYVYSGAVYVAFSATLTWMLSRTVGLLAGALVAFLFLVTNPFTEVLPLLLAVGWSFAAMRADRPAAALSLLAIGGGVLCAVEPLVKLSVGPPIVLICLLGMIGARAGRRQWAAFLTIGVAGFLAAWFLAGQGLGNLWDYAVNGASIVAGYSEAMGFDQAPAWQAVAIGVFGVGLVALVSRAELRDPRARWSAMALTALAALVLFKYGVTQFSAGGPPAIALSSLLVIYLMTPLPPRQAVPFLAAAAAIGVVVIHTYPFGARPDVVANLKRFEEQTELAIRPGLRQQHVDAGRAEVQEGAAMDPRVLAAVQGKRVAVEPWEMGVVWAFGLDWAPLPAFQSYVAYTSRLDRLNAAAIDDANGPEILLRQIPPEGGPVGSRPQFMERQPLWDPPEQNLATVCNFAPTLTTERWQVLSRVPDRCAPPTLIERHRGEPGEAVEVPQAGPGELVVLRLGGAGVEGLEKLASLFWRPTERHASLDDGRHVYRLVPGTSGDGLIVSADRSLDGKADFAELPVARSIAVGGADGPLQFDFYRVRLKRS